VSEYFKIRINDRVWSVRIVEELGDKRDKCCCFHEKENEGDEEEFIVAGT